MSSHHPATRILLVGATGYVGGTVLHRLLTGPNALSKICSITVLVRGEDRATKLGQVYGDRIVTTLFKNLDDTDIVEDIASQHDLIINAGTGFHLSSAVAMVRGLSRRHRDHGQQQWLIHTAGTSNCCDSPYSGESYPERWFDDADSLTTYEFEKAEDKRVPYPQRTTELAVLDAGEETGVNVISLQIGAIIGEGGGLFSTSPSLVSILMRLVLEKGCGFQFGDGTGQIGFVHVIDLADLYVLLCQRLLRTEDGDLPRGRSGIIFPCVGMIKFMDISRGCVEAAWKRGVLPKDGGPQTKDIRKIDMEEFVSFLGEGPIIRHVASTFAAHWNTIGTIAKGLGWQPAHSFEAMQKEYDTELVAVLQGKRQCHLHSILAQED
ncbi:hypothetical protein N0V82_003021 [Gnomoniopsis sp. IMI 355080]|nr:hypothetical protein N0V82_003021 [Gnomoniopsis sp. IMI 355080]